MYKKLQYKHAREDFAGNAFAIFSLIFKESGSSGHLEQQIKLEWPYRSFVKFTLNSKGHNF